MKLCNDDCKFANDILLGKKDVLYRITSKFRNLYCNTDYWEATHDSDVFPDLNWNISQNVTHIITNDIK